MSGTKGVMIEGPSKTATIFEKDWPRSREDSETGVGRIDRSI